MSSIWKENYELMKELQSVATAYVTYVQMGGHIGSYPDQLVNKAIAVCQKVKANRDSGYEYAGKQIPSIQDECKTAVSLINGSYAESPITGVFERLYSM